MQIGNINLYDPDIHKIPEYNWQKAQRCLILDSGLGSTVKDLFAHADNIQTYATNDRKEDLVNELTNFKMSLYSAIEGINYTSMTFACFVKDIDGVAYPIDTDTDINNLSQLVAGTGITHAQVQDYLNDLKKKLIPN